MRLHDPSAQSLRLVFLLIFVMGVAPSPVFTAGCPDRCVCDEQLVVQCSGQHLTEFPLSLPLATRQLIISNNLIRELPALELNYLSDLVYLDCSNNSLSEIVESTFGNLKKLAFLDLSFNALTVVDDRTFSALVGLVMLRLTDNPGLSEVHPEAFAENTGLQVVDISRNNLTLLNITSYITMPALRALGLSGNPWRCDCDNEDLCLWMQLEPFRFQDQGVTLCQSPQDMVGQRLADVGYQLREDCHPGLDYWDYVFLTAVGIAIFSGGTISAWVMGVVFVLYDRYFEKKEDDEEGEEEDFQRDSSRNGDVKPGKNV
uniref:Leucine-rich repeat-containing protein 52-like n=1 Tax=Paramormyrops kingsleyae TaxID=1676925 RepID=A0A3B3RS18_9TELE|nr:leucine-rich repeat-containing protein 52-like [Paramormyrops kingsleyae]